LMDCGRCFFQRILFPAYLRVPIFRLLPHLRFS
jgi:hypothetical protein